MKKKLLLAMILAGGVAQGEIKQQLGVDPSVDYASLEQMGPWDDRNYQLTKEDLAVLPANDVKVNGVPVFFKVLARKERPELGEFYPRVLRQSFLMNYGGLLVDGIWYKEGLGKYYFPEDTYGKKPEEERNKAINDNEVPMPGITNGNEISVEMKPSDPMVGVAGANGNGQSMYWTSDGGATWTKSQDNPGASCCDPTIDWSFDSSRVYQADLASCGAGCNIRATYSDDDGHTWQPMVTVDGGGGSDKEFIHVDRSASSPYKDNVYITYHTSNVLQFAKSTDMGVSWSTPHAFSSDPVGIGSDITTDTAGNIFYIYASTAPGGGVRMLKSTDGGTTFAASTQIAPLNDVFDFPVPSMESRNVFVYAATDVDVNNNNIYVAWTDQTDQSTNGGASANHAWVNVAKSVDAGATWTMCPHPHPTADELTVDRYHPWIKVGENGVVHVGYYDTRHSTNRTGVDFYYASSTDACATWETPVRVTTETSTNISNGQEWGDYNGLSIVADRLMASFTDNRPSGSQSAMVVSGDNPKGSPSYNLGSATPTIAVCSGDTGATATIDVTPLMGYTNDVALSNTVTPSFVSNLVLTPATVTGGSGSSVMTFDVGAGGTLGSNTLTIEGTGNEMPPNVGTITRSYNFDVVYSGGTTSAISLTAPADNATNVSATATFTWAVDANATAYKIQIATSPTFGASNIVSEIVNNNSYTAAGLPTSTVLYWRVKGKSACNQTSQWSSVQTFSTVSLPGDCAIGDVPMTYNNYDFESGAQGWTHNGLTGSDAWALSAAPVHSGVQAFHGAEFGAVNDSDLVSPVINVPAASFGPLTLQFWNRQEMEDSGTGCFDGGILEASTDGGTVWTQIDTSKMINDPYDGAVSSSWSSPLAGLNAWCGDPQDWLNSKVDIDAFAGQSVQFRFRKANDSSVDHVGWDIDDVKIMGCASDLIFKNGFE